MQIYELTLVTPVMADSKQKGFAEKLEKLIGEAGGKVEKKDEWGRKELAYPLKKNKEGYYYNLLVGFDMDKVNGIARYLDNDDEVLRHLIVKSKIQKSKSKNVESAITERPKQAKKKATTTKRSVKGVKSK